MANIRIDRVSRGGQVVGINAQRIELTGPRGTLEVQRLKAGIVHIHDQIFEFHARGREDSDHADGGVAVVYMKRQVRTRGRRSSRSPAGIAEHGHQTTTNIKLTAGSPVLTV